MSFVSSMMCLMFFNFFYIKKFLMSVLPARMQPHTMLCNAHRGQRRAWNHLELELPC